MTTPVTTAAAAAGSLVDEAEHGQVDHLAGAAHDKRGRPRVDPVYYWFLIPTLALFTLAITVPAVLGIFYSFTNFIGFADSSENSAASCVQATITSSAAPSAAWNAPASLRHSS